MISRALRVLFCVAFGLCTTRLAWAQSVQVRTQASSRSVEVGESFTVTFTALVDNPNPLPHSPSLRAPAGLSLHGPSVASQQQISLSAGKFIRRSGISATWTLEASKAGHYRIGPPTVEVSGQRASGDVVDVDVVPAGQGRPKPHGFESVRPLRHGIPAHAQAARLRRRAR